MAKSKITRRTALAMLASILAAGWAAVAAAMSAVVLGSNRRSGSGNAVVRIGDVSMLGDSFTQIRLDLPIQDGWHERTEHKILYMRQSDDSPDKPLVLSATCTHLGCTVNWKSDEGSSGEFVCPCHGGRFDRNGNVISGPPPKPLKRVPANVENGEIYARLV